MSGRCIRVAMEPPEMYVPVFLNLQCSEQNINCYSLPEDGSFNQSLELLRRLKRAQTFSSEIFKFFGKRFSDINAVTLFVIWRFTSAIATKLQGEKENFSKMNEQMRLEGIIGKDNYERDRRRMIRVKFYMQSSFLTTNKTYAWLPKGFSSFITKNNRIKVHSSFSQKSFASTTSQNCKN